MRSARIRYDEDHHPLAPGRPQVSQFYAYACAAGQERRHEGGGGGAENGRSVNWAFVAPMLARLSPRIEAGDFNLYCPVCQGLLKGGSVMFGERVDPGQLERALRALLGADLLVVLGTSLLVSTAADMLRWAREAGIPFAIVNATPTPYDRHAAVTVAGDVGPVMDDAVALASA